MSDVNINEQIDRIKNALEEDNSIEIFRAVLTEIKSIEKKISASRFADGNENGSFIITDLYVNTQPSDCCNGCVTVPKLYTAYTNDEFLDELLESDFEEFENNIRDYLRLAEEVLS